MFVLSVVAVVSCTEPDSHRRELPFPLPNPSFANPLDTTDEFNMVGLLQTDSRRAGC